MNLNQKADEKKTYDDADADDEIDILSSLIDRHFFLLLFHRDQKNVQNKIELLLKKNNDDDDNNNKMAINFT